MSLASAINLVESSLKSAKNCSCGLVCQNRVFGTERGPSGGAELLATLFIDDPFFGFWYGHVLPHPLKQNRYVAVIVWSEKLVNASRVPLLFRRFWYWVKDRLNYQPCTIQYESDAYAETESFESAAEALCRMIKRFDIDQRSGLEGSDYEQDPCEMRILEVYGLEDSQDADGNFPSVPLLTPLSVVDGGLSN